MLDKNYLISTDQSKLNIIDIHQYLSKDSYWAKGRSLEIVKNSINNSLCFGVYFHEKQVGFARVVTDFAVFAWIMDVYILKEHQGKGLGKRLMDTIISHPQLQTLSRWGLNTFDAHSLYAKYNFAPIEKPEIYMERIL